MTMTYLDCWKKAAATLLPQALAGEPEFSESLPKPFGAGSFGFAVNIAGEQEGRFAVVLDAGMLETPLMGEGIDQKAAWGELLREVAESAVGEMLAKTGVKLAVDKMEEIPGESKISQAFQLKTASGDWTILVRDEVRVPKKTEAAAPAGSFKANTAARTAAGKKDAAVTSIEDRPGVDLLMDVELEATLRFGSREIPLGDLLELGPGDVVQLDRHVNDPVDLIVADKIVARGDVVLVNGNFGLRITEVAEPRLRLETIRCLF
jgi:flagellar motor switch protein FliN/FliY